MQGSSPCRVPALHLPGVNRDHTPAGTLRASTAPTPVAHGIRGWRRRASPPSLSCSTTLSDDRMRLASAAV